MQRRQVAKTDLWVSALGLGTVKLGRNQGVKYPKQFSIPDDRAVLSLLSQAKELGINLIDTAPAYGSSEERLGSLLHKVKNDWLICTKVGESFEQGQSSFDFTPEAAQLSIERSCQRLNVDCLDMVLVHSDGNDEYIIQHFGILDYLSDLKKTGKIRAFGMSTKTVEGGILAASQADIVMATYNLADQSEQPVLDYATANQKAIFVKKALGSGHICLEDGDPVKKSMAFIFAHPAVTSTIVGTITPTHLAHNAACISEVLD
ncbi:aldo/keto reductase [Zooshikella ganghwensis]|uniref:Aldo/keto reductase n=1 Tax=Zooshikella ganghwensis TaxID=202772 RepID=A0A4P9VJZ8_9GAMM|nr:aldo/keto reductase [Zooshikella ganghwensis]RDH42480.1 aldo/keto reductase [Zooshikella ganghwensis]